MYVLWLWKWLELEPEMYKKKKKKKEIIIYNEKLLKSEDPLIGWAYEEHSVNISRALLFISKL